MGLTIAEPIWLLALVSIPFFYILYLHSLKKKKDAVLKFSKLGLIKQSSSTTKSIVRRHITFILTILTLTFLILALADPHIPLKKIHKGVNVVLAIDVSGSMKATDYQPTRIDAAKRSAKILVDSLTPNDNMGIVVFSDGATSASFFTALKERTLSKLASVQANDGRTAIGDGLALAVDMVTSVPNKKKVIILLSDGVSNSGIISPDEAIEFAKANDIQVYTIGMGSEEKTILGYDFFGRPQYAELDESTLIKIAESTGGKYFKAVDDATLNKIYEGISNDIEREKEDTSIKNWFIALAMFTIIVELYIRYSKKFRIVTGDF